jgi:cell wall-associated NlpC family hydrolase
MLAVTAALGAVAAGCPLVALGALAASPRGASLPAGTRGGPLAGSGGPWWPPPLSILGATWAPALAPPAGFRAQLASSLAHAGIAARRAVRFALGQLGVPYRWGGEGPQGFDCSGLVQAAYASAGVRLPRVAQAQFDAGPHLAAGEPLVAGDLVFFGPSPRDVEHVGIYLADGRMIDAPHTGAVVRIEPLFSDYVGATRPG